MERIASRILFFSDPHFSVNSEAGEEKWFPPVCNFLGKFPGKTEKFLHFWDQVTQKAFSRMLSGIEGAGQYDYAFGLGDYTPGANESGMITRKAIDQYNLFKMALENQVRCQKVLVWGDHDVGYRFNVSKKVMVKIGTEKGGLSQKSIESATELIGHPFGVVDIGPAKFIYISTNLVRNVDENSPYFLRELKMQQEYFLQAHLQWSKHPLNFILLHDPTAIAKKEKIRKILDSNMRKVSGIIHGHLHAEFSRQLTMLSPVYRGLCRDFETILVPASWGMFGIGGGFLVMEISADGNFQMKKYKMM